MKTDNVTDAFIRDTTRRTLLLASGIAWTSAVRNPHVRVLGGLMIGVAVF